MCVCMHVCVQEVDERFFLIFPSTFVILGVGQILSGYELKVKYPISVR